MEYNPRGYAENNESSVDSVFTYIDYIVKKWWIILAVAAACAIVGFAYAKITYVPTYSSNIKFVANNRAEGTNSTGQSSSDLTAGSTLANNYKYLLTTTRGLLQAVADDVGNGISYEEVSRSVKASVITDTSLVNFTVTTTNPDKSYAIAMAFINNYDTYAQTAFPSTTLKVFDNPYRAEKADTNNSRVVYTLIGFLIGAFVTIGISCLIVAARDTVKGSDDILGKLDLRLIGTVNHVNRKGNQNSPVLISDKSSGFSFVETFKLIRTKIENFASRENCKTFVITSTLEDEGKTTVSCNVALALAKNGKSVLLIDGDLRKPAIYKTLGISAANESGLAGIINGTKSIADSVKFVEKYNLFVMLNGTGIPEASEILSSDKMNDIISALEKEFDYIIIDSAPAGVVADTSILANSSDAIILVVKEDKASIRRIRRTIDDLSNSEKEIVGCIYNSADSGLTSKIKSAYKGSNGKYGYGYGYPYGYGQAKKKSKK